MAEASPSASSQGGSEDLASDPEGLTLSSSGTGLRELWSWLGEGIGCPSLTSEKAWKGVGALGTFVLKYTKPSNSSVRCNKF